MWFRYCVLVVSLLSVGDALAVTDSRCGHLQGLDKLACQKSAHKIKGLTARPKQSADAVVDAVPSLVQKQPSKSRLKKKPKARHHLSHNRKQAANRHMDPSASKKSKKHAVADHDQKPNLVSAQAQELSQSGLVSSRGMETLASDSDLVADVSLRPHLDMLASDSGLDPLESGVGDDALYRIY